VVKTTGKCAVELIFFIRKLSAIKKGTLIATQQNTFEGEMKKKTLQPMV
jgi:hypothetical protein